jgi:flagellar biosynthesis anti-sigma factor FlgM
MEIQGDFRPLDPATRKRQSEAAKAAGGDQRPAGKPGDAVRLDETSPQQIDRYVQILKSMNPADLHRIEELRARIRDGSYRADAESLAGPLADLLDDQSPRTDG